MKRALVRTPQSGAVLNLLGSVLRAHLDNSISGSDVVQQKVAEGMNYFIPQSLRNNEHATIDDRPCRSGGNGLHVADTTTDPSEKLSAS